MCRTVEDVMTGMWFVPARTPVQGLVKLLAARRVSAVPVVDDRRHVLGVASEADLLFKQHKPARPGIGLLSALRRPGGLAKARATVAAELMSRPAVTIGQGATLTEAARRLHTAGVKRLPVVDPVGRLVGILSRVDLLKVFLRSDEDLYREIVDDIIFGELFMGRTGSTSMSTTEWWSCRAAASGAVSSRRWCGRWRAWRAWSGSRTGSATTSTTWPSPLPDPLARRVS